MGRWREYLAFSTLLALAAFPASALPHPRPDEALVLETTPSPTPSEGSPTPETSQSVDFASLAGLPPPGFPVLSGSLPSSSPEPETASKLELPPPEVRSLHVNSLVQYRYAHTVVSSRIANPAKRSQEVTFSVVLPKDAYISSFLMEVDGKVYKAYVKEKEQAKATYDSAVAAGQSAAHVAVDARDSNSFTVSVNVEPLNKVSFNLTYEELLERKVGNYKHVITLNPGQVVKDLMVRVHIKESKNLTALRVPEFSSGNKVDGEFQDCDELSEVKSAKCTSGNQLATIKRISPKEAEIIFKPSPQAQKQIVDKREKEKEKKKHEEYSPYGYGGERDGAQPDKGLNGQFLVEYDVEHDPTGGEVMVNEGFFVHFFSPTDLPPLKKHAIFVLDVSGSMDGRKMEQLKQAMNSILSELKSGDYFHLIEFSGGVKVWNLDDPDRSAVSGGDDYWFPPADAPTTTRASVTELPPAYPANKTYVDKAKDIIKGMRAYGGTNIYDAMTMAISCARQAWASKNEKERPEPIIVFLTDGDPTVGETRTTKITSGISDLNVQPRTSVFSLAFGESADIKFLRKLSLANGGFAKNIYEAADASKQLEGFFKEIASPLLTNVTFKYPPEQVQEDSLTQMTFPIYFGGSEIVVAGRTAPEVLNLDSKVFARGDGANSTNYTAQVITVDEPLTIYPFDDIAGPVLNLTATPADRKVSVLERLWVYLNIRQLLNEQDTLDAKLGKSDGSVPYYGPPTTTSVPEVVNVTDLGNLTDIFKAEPKKRALELALKYSFVTPLTSLVVVKPNETKATDAQTVTPGREGGGYPFASGAAGLSAGAGSIQLSRFGNAGFGGAAASALGAPPSSMGAPYMPMGAFGGGFGGGLAGLPPSPAMSGPPSGSISSGLTLSSLPAYTNYKLMAVLHLERNEDTDISSAWQQGSSHATLNISDVTWLPSDALEKGVVSLPNVSTNSLQQYRVAYGEDDVSPKSCSNSNVVNGLCRHLSNCVLPNVATSLVAFAEYQCVNGDYLSICCPVDVTPRPSAAVTTTPISMP